MVHIYSLQGTILLFISDLKPFSNFMQIANVSLYSPFEGKILATYFTAEFYAFVNLLIVMVTDLDGTGTPPLTRFLGPC